MRINGGNDGDILDMLDLWTALFLTICESMKFAAALGSGPPFCFEALETEREQPQ